MNRLEEILCVKRAEIERERPHEARLREQALQRNDFRGFKSALERIDGNLAVVAEVKKASPSAGLIARSFNPVAIAHNYESSGADAISVLTDEQFFRGQLRDLAQVRGEVSLPLLRKDFILDELQIVQSAATGADAILLIVAALAQKQLVDLSKAAEKYQLDALLEVHSTEELDRAIDAGAEIIGINNRDLTTLDVDLSVTEKLSEKVPNGIVLVSESGIKSAADAARMKRCGISAILVGEALMRGETSIEVLRGRRGG
jgi:indole-3-glycerol phosphate synthase